MRTAFISGDVIAKGADWRRVDRLLSFRRAFLMRSIWFAQRAELTITATDECSGTPLACF